MKEPEKPDTEQEKKLFILTSAAMIEALKNNKDRSKELLKQGGPIAQERILITTDRLKDWIAEVKE
jgi:hypothetical protein